jgi:hypothetical protein
VGRLAYTSRYGPAALPVEYVVYEGSVVVRAWATSTEEDLGTGIAHAEYVVAVEADQVDLEAREGWVVLVRGAAHHLDTEAERAPVIDAGLAPWTGGSLSTSSGCIPPVSGATASAGHDASDGETRRNKAEHLVAKCGQVAAYRG